MILRIKKSSQIALETKKIITQQNTRIKWTFVELMTTIAWFIERNAKTSQCDRVNVSLKSVKMNVIKKIYENLNFVIIKFEIDVDKLIVKFVAMLITYKNIRNKVDNINWIVDSKSHDQSVADQKKIKRIFIIRIIILNKCAWYYEYEKIFCDKFNVTLFFLFEFDQSNCRNFKFVDANDDDFIALENAISVFQWSTIQAFVEFENVDFTDENSIDVQLVHDIVKETTAKKTIVSRTHLNDFYVRFHNFDQMLQTKQKREIVANVVDDTNRVVSANKASMKISAKIIKSIVAVVFFNDQIMIDSFSVVVDFSFSFQTRFVKKKTKKKKRRDHRNRYRFRQRAFQKEAQQCEET